MATDADPEVLPYFWTDAVPFYAAYYALLSAQTGQRMADDFHVFAVEWEASVLRFYVDGQLYETRTPASLPGGTRWVFDHPFFLVLDLAIGGEFAGPPSARTPFPARMLVDWVHVMPAGATAPAVHRAPARRLPSRPRA